MTTSDPKVSPSTLPGSPASDGPPVRPAPTQESKPQDIPGPSPRASNPSPRPTHTKKRRKSRSTASSSQPRQEQRTFGELPVSAAIGRALENMGYTAPTSIQGEIIPLVRAGKDVVGQAQTGTGKTAAFGIPLVETMNGDIHEPQALVLTPTRELAVQVRGEISRLGQFCGTRVVAVYGGQAMSRQMTALNRGAHIVVATPGRLIDHMGRGTIDISKVRYVVLDEADQMLDIGFAEDMEYILRYTPRSRQTLLFSATIPGPIKRLAQRYLREPSWIRIGGDAEPVEQVKQVYYEIAERDCASALEELLRQPGLISQALIFRRTRAGVDRLVAYLQSRNHDAQAIHGDMSQSHRDAVMTRFRSKNLRILVATNVAARGLDIPAVSHVINYDMPETLEEYIHRIGRTARMGRTGTAITFVSEWDFPVLDMIQAHVGDDLARASLASSHR